MFGETPPAEGRAEDTGGVVASSDDEQAQPDANSQQAQSASGNEGAQADSGNDTAQPQATEKGWMKTESVRGSGESARDFLLRIHDPGETRRLQEPGDAHQSPEPGETHQSPEPGE